MILVGWSLGGVFAREVAKVRPELVEKVITLGSPFSGDMRGNNVWRLYEWIAGHPVDDPPIDTDRGEAAGADARHLVARGRHRLGRRARGEAHQSDRRLELDCSHMGFAVSGRAYPKIVAAVKDF